jgi:hypothetical protein
LLDVRGEELNPSEGRKMLVVDEELAGGWGYAAGEDVEEASFAGSRWTLDRGEASFAEGSGIGLQDWGRARVRESEGEGREGVRSELRYCCQVLVAGLLTCEARLVAAPILDRDRIGEVVETDAERIGFGLFA